MAGWRNEIELGDIVLEPQTRTFAGPNGTIQVEPLVMRLTAALIGKAGRVVERSALFEQCWPGTPMGDDSLNRLVAGARRALRSVGSLRTEILTVPAAGYLLRLLKPSGTGEQIAQEAGKALCAALQSWRMAAPAPDFPAIARLGAVVEADPENASCLGMLALMYRHAAEYGAAREREEFVTSCESVAQRALECDPCQTEAAIALIGIVPLFGHWGVAHDRLSEILVRQPDHVIAAHDLSIIEMATGRVREAKRLIDPLIAADPVAPCFAYKSTYHHWSLDDWATMDQRADRAFQLWPHHPAVWTARFWTLAFTSRHAAALQMLSGEAIRPPIPDRLAQFLRQILVAATAGIGDHEELANQALQAVVEGPAQAVNSLMALGLLADVDRSFGVADAFYSRHGEVSVPMHSTQVAPVNEMGRRLTQVLFTPACAAMRSDPKFSPLCERIGLASYWRETNRRPDLDG